MRIDLYNRLIAKHASRRSVLKGAASAGALAALSSAGIVAPAVKQSEGVSVEAERDQNPVQSDAEPIAPVPSRHFRPPLAAYRYQYRFHLK